MIMATGKSYSLVLSALTTLWLSALCVTSAGADPVSVQYNLAADELRVTFHWPRLPEYTQEVKARELLMRFSRPLEAPDALALPSKVPEWISDVRTGYDSLLIHAAQDVEYSVHAERDKVLVTMRRADKKTAGVNTSPTTNTERMLERQRLRTELLRARALLEIGRLGQARTILEQMIEEEPERVEPLLSLADLETRAGRWRKALTLYNRSLTLVDDPSVAKAKAQLLSQHGQFVRTDFGTLINNDADTQLLFTASGKIFSGSWSDIGFEYQGRHVDAPSVARPDGDTSGFTGIRHRFELKMSGEFQSGIELTGRFFGTEEHLGIGGDATGKIGVNRLTLSLRYHEPYWTLLEGVVSGGAADRLAIEYARPLGPHVWLQAKAGANAYSIGNATHGAKSATGTLAVRYLPRLADGVFSLGYIFDGEFPFDVEEKTDDDGLEFNPVNIIRREVHSLELGYFRDLTDSIAIGGSVVYSYDRVGGEGPGGNVELTYKPITPWEFGIRGGISAVSLRGGDEGPVITASLYAKRKF